MSADQHVAMATTLLAATVNESASETELDHHEAADGAGGYDYSYFLAALAHALLAIAGEFREANDIARRANDIARSNRRGARTRRQG